MPCSRSTERPEAFAHVCDVGRAHRQAGMAGIRLLDGVHREAPDRIGHTGVIDLRHDENPPEMRCLVTFRAGANGRGTSRLAEPEAMESEAG